MVDRSSTLPPLFAALKLLGLVVMPLVPTDSLASTELGLTWQRTQLFGISKSWAWRHSSYCKL